jgi:hypothetical protein
MGGRWTVGEAEGGGAIEGEGAEESGGEKSRCGRAEEFGGGRSQHGSCNQPSRLTLIYVYSDLGNTQT